MKKIFTFIIPLVQGEASYPLKSLSALTGKHIHHLRTRKAPATGIVHTMNQKPLVFKGFDSLMLNLRTSSSEHVFENMPLAHVVTKTDKSPCEGEYIGQVINWDSSTITSEFPTDMTTGDHVEITVVYEEK